MTIGDNTNPMEFNQLGKIPIWFQSLPFQAVFSALEKGTCAAFDAVVPKLSEGFLEYISRFQMPIGLKQFFQSASYTNSGSHVARAVYIDVTTVLTAETFVFT